MPETLDPGRRAAPPATPSRAPAPGGATGAADPKGAAPRVLEIGCGPDPPPGVVGLDRLPLRGVAVVHDVDATPWPLPDDAFDEVLCQHVLEHVDDICGVMDELHRVTRAGGRVRIVVPYFARYSAFKDPTHRRFCTFESFNYFVDGTEERDRSYSARAFRYVERELQFPTSLRGRIGSWIARRDPRRYERRWALRLPARTLRIVLEPIKDAGTGGAPAA